MQNKVVKTKKKLRTMETTPVRADKSDLLEVTNIITAEKYVKMINGAIRTIPDFPREGMFFRDLTTLWKEPEVYQASISAMKLFIEDDFVNIKIAGIEARGWVYAATLADRMYRPFIAIRKNGVLPANTITAYYNAEFDDNAIEIHEDAISKGDRVILVDDLIATGKTLRAATKCIERLGGEIIKIVALADIEKCGGKDYLRKHGYTTRTVITYPN